MEKSKKRGRKPKNKKENAPELLAVQVNETEFEIEQLNRLVQSKKLELNSVDLEVSSIKNKIIGIEKELESEDTTIQELANLQGKQKTLEESSKKANEELQNVELKIKQLLMKRSTLSDKVNIILDEVKREQENAEIGRAHV